MFKGKPILYKRDCPHCHKPWTLVVGEENMADWRLGKLIQDAFPYLGAAEREVMITGICPSCWPIIMQPTDFCLRCNAEVPVQEIDDHVFCKVCLCDTALPLDKRA